MSQSPATPPRRAVFALAAATAVPLPSAAQAMSAPLGFSPLTPAYAARDHAMRDLIAKARAAILEEMSIGDELGEDTSAHKAAVARSEALTDAIYAEQSRLLDLEAHNWDDVGILALLMEFSQGDDVHLTGDVFAGIVLQAMGLNRLPAAA